MPETCKWLHENLENLPLFRCPIDLRQLPKNGVYFFYEDGEVWGHGGNDLRIVRVGSHRQGNFRSRIKEHYLLDESKMSFDCDKLKPSDRSIFRKNIGRAILNKNKDNYLEIWDIDFTYKKTRENLGHLRDIQKEKEIEFATTKILRNSFSFRFLIIENQYDRIGSQGIESSLIGIVANCHFCKGSDNWLGKYSPINKIRDKGLWLVRYLHCSGITEDDKKIILNAIIYTQEWMNRGFKN